MALQQSESCCWHTHKAPIYLRIHAQLTTPFSQRPHGSSDQQLMSLSGWTQMPRSTDSIPMSFCACRGWTPYKIQICTTTLALCERFNDRRARLLCSFTGLYHFCDSRPSHRLSYHVQEALQLGVGLVLPVPAVLHAKESERRAIS